MTIQRGNLLLAPVLFLSLLLSPYISAFDSWRIPPGEWTQRDVERLLNDSPWCLQVEATMDDPLDQREETPMPLPGAAEAGMPGGGVQDGKPRWDGGIGKNRMGRLATIPVTVRWDSATVVQQALQRKHDPGVAELSAAAPKNFILTVVGLLPANQGLGPATLQTKSSSDSGPTVHTTEELLEWFMGNARLMEKGQPSLQPKNVEIDSTTGAVRIFFNRSDEFVAHKRDVYFVTRFGSMNVTARFRPKDMLVAGHPDL
jgi:hypothetical protein